MQKAMWRGRLIINGIFFLPRQPNAEGGAKGSTNYHVFFFSPPDSLMQKAVDGGALDVLDEYIRYHQQDHGLCNMVLLTLGSFIDSGIHWSHDQSAEGNGQ